jgi:2-polyprenyl-3-methyl-5-hydroxy-6-metoxy-1,4-benzoquinol methylase
MAKTADYRSRLFDSYYTTHWKFHHSESKQEYELYRRTARKKFNRFLPADKNAEILDVACGGGHFLCYLQSEGYARASGIDISPEMTAFAKKMGARNVEQGDLFQVLKKRKARLDMIVANDVIEHYRKDEIMEFLDLIRAALVPGGKVLIQTINCQSLFGATGRYFDFTHETGFTSGSLDQVMRAAGFARVCVYGEKPAAHDFRSAVRCFLWGILDRMFKAYIAIEAGTGRGLKRDNNIFEPRMFAIAEKPRKQ